MKTRWTKEKCNSCHYLGEFKVDEAEYDLYFHHNANETTIIARYGEDGDYYSGIVFGVMGKNRPLKEALKRALRVPEFRRQVTNYVYRWEHEFPERTAAFEGLLHDTANEVVDETRQAEDMPSYEDLVQALYHMFDQHCSKKPLRGTAGGMYNHKHLSANEEAQSLLLRLGMVKSFECEVI